jgi:hypothetical protein
MWALQIPCSGVKDLSPPCGEGASREVLEEFLSRGRNILEVIDKDMYLGLF